MLKKRSIHVNHAGIYSEEVSCATVINCMDKLNRWSTISCLHSTHTTQTGSMVHCIQQHWLLVHRICSKNLCERISNYYFVSNDVLNVLYVKWQGVVCSGITIFIQLWCTEQRGPVFVTMFNPLGAVLTALQSYFLLGERLHMGRYNHQCYIHFQEPHTHTQGFRWL